MWAPSSTSMLKEEISDMPRFIYMDELGEGSYGLVVKAMDYKKKELVAVKILKSPFHKSQDLTELKCLTFLQHPNVIHLETSYKQNFDGAYHVCLVFEFMQRDLHEFLRNRSEAPSLDEIRYLARQLLQGLQYIHESGYFHRDLKPANLLLQKNMQLKIGDFGMARKKNSRLPLEANVTTLHYRAPEVLLGAQYYDEAIDMWAAGAIIAELFALKPLFCGQDEFDQLLKICHVLGSPHMDSWEEGLELANSINFNFPFKPPKETLFNLLPTAILQAQDLIYKLLEWNPSYRLCAKAALLHPFLNPPHVNKLG